jgi:hypothetical protein
MWDRSSQVMELEGGMGEEGELRWEEVKGTWCLSV